MNPIKTYRNILFVVLSSFLMAFSCGDKVDGGHKCISFVNMSQDTVYLAEKSLRIIEPSDTFINCHGYQVAVLPGDTMQVHPANNYWETEFKIIPYFQLFVLPRKTFDLPCDEARKYVIKRYQLTRNDLDSLGWIVIYP